MLAELAIRNFAVIREARVEFGPGMNAITGETGAGKSIVLDALSAVLGARTSSDFVRTGETRAYVEAVFDIDHDQRDALLELLREYGIDELEDGTVTLARDINANGRSTARINGRTLTASAQAALGELLVDIHGQSDHLSLLRPAAQLDLLDAFAGVWDQRGRVARLYREWRSVRARLEGFVQEQRSRAQRLDLLRFQSEEISSAELRPGEDEELRNQRSVLVNAERLADVSGDAHRKLAGNEDAFEQTPDALDLLRSIEDELSGLVEVDGSLKPLLEGVRESLYNLEEISIELRDYAERVQFDPVQLQEVEDRLDIIRNLTNKYGPTIDDVLEHLSTIETELNQLELEDTDIEAVRMRERDLAGELAGAACELSSQRKKAAIGFANGVEQAIADLNMGAAEFEIRFSVTDQQGGVSVGKRQLAVTETGIDHVDYYLAANRGDELRPLGRVASGGETARLMLALKSILSQADKTPTLIFDEIDVGVGGRSGQVVGEKLWNLAGDHQVIVISHLPQVAAFAERHISMVKVESDGRTETTAVALEGNASVDEIATMFDGKPVSPESRANAQALIARVSDWKAKQR